MVIDELIREMLATADQAGNNPTGSAVVRPLQRYGRVWFSQGHWWFTERKASIVTYTAATTITSSFGENQFVVTDAYWPMDHL